MRWPLVFFLAGLLAGLGPGQEPAPLDDDERILHVLSRLTFGPRPGDLERVRALGLARWLDAQLAPASIDDAALDARLAGFDTLGLTPKAWLALLEEKREEKEGASPRARRREEREAVEELVKAVVLRAAASERQVLEVLADFWRNHFNVDRKKDGLNHTISHWEHAVVRAHALGGFEDFLLATARHPAMLVYLDNALSRRPPSRSELRRVERRARRETGSRDLAAQAVRLAEQRGLNENYARELMELHTLGVDNGYTQKDVVEVARALTGWSVDRAAGDTWFSFNEEMHDPDPKFLMGKALPEAKREGGIVEGEAVVRMLARHRNTSELIARKLCRRLVADLPPPALVEHAAKAFRAGHGNVAAVVRAIVEHPAFFDRAHYRTKFKTPLELVISAIRITGSEVVDAAAVARTVEELGMPIYGCEDPTGYSDAAEAWRDPGVMALRWRFAVQLARGKHPGCRLPETFFDGLPKGPPALAAALARRIVPQGIGAATAAVLERAVFRLVQAGGRNDLRGLAADIAGVLIGSPEFQQQ